MAYDSSEFDGKVMIVLGDIQAMLQNKNRKYGNSALAPKTIFSKQNPIERLKVRIDDKLLRLEQQNVDEDEDVLRDLIGYLVLLDIALQERNGGKVDTKYK